MTPLDALLYIAIGFGSSVIGTLSTGAGLISVPALIFMGLSPQQAIATSRLGGVITTGSGMAKYYRAKMIRWQYLPVLVPIAIAASFIGGTALTEFHNQALLEQVIGVVLLILLPIILFEKRVAKKLKNHRHSKLVGYVLYFAVLSFAAFFPGGSGGLAMIVLSYFLGIKLIEANATNLVAWLFMQIVTSVLFILSGIVRFDVFVALSVGNIFGGYMGAQLAVKKGDGLVRVVLAVVVAAAAIRMIWY